MNAYAKEGLGDEKGAIEDKLKAEELESSKLKILLIDTDENICQLLREIFLEENYRVDYCLRGEAGLESVKREEYNLVILDFIQRGIPGEEILVQIKKYDSAIPVIILTAYSDVQTAKECATKGADAFMAKPFEQNEILEQVKNIINTKTN